MQTLLPAKSVEIIERVKAHAEEYRLCGRVKDAKELERYAVKLEAWMRKA